MRIALSAKGGLVVAPHQSAIFGVDFLIMIRTSRFSFGCNGIPGQVKMIVGISKKKQILHRNGHVLFSPDGAFVLDVYGHKLGGVFLDRR